MSTAAASHLSPAFPERAAWGTASKLRAWQADALTQYLRSTPRDFLAVATPGAGKTTYALRLATELFATGLIRRVTVVAPTEHLKTQWADAASRVGIRIDPHFTNASGRHGARLRPPWSSSTRSTTAGTTSPGVMRSARHSSRLPIDSG